MASFLDKASNLDWIQEYIDRGPMISKIKEIVRFSENPPSFDLHRPVLTYRRTNASVRWTNAITTCHIRIQVDARSLLIATNLKLSQEICSDFANVVPLARWRGETSTRVVLPPLNAIMVPDIDPYSEWLKSKDRRLTLKPLVIDLVGCQRIDFVLLELSGHYHQMSYNATGKVLTEHHPEVMTDLRAIEWKCWINYGPGVIEWTVYDTLSSVKHSILARVKQNNSIACAFARTGILDNTLAWINNWKSVYPISLPACRWFWPRMLTPCGEDGALFERSDSYAAVLYLVPFSFLRWLPRDIIGILLELLLLDINKIDTVVRSSPPARVRGQPLCW